MIKPSKVVFISDDLEDSFNSLPEDDFVKKSMIRAIKDLKQNAFSGIHVPKRLIPHEYIRKWGINFLTSALICIVFYLTLNYEMISSSL